MNNACNWQVMKQVTLKGKSRLRSINYFNAVKSNFSVQFDRSFRAMIPQKCDSRDSHQTSQLFTKNQLIFLSESNKTKNHKPLLTMIDKKIF